MSVRKSLVALLVVGLLASCRQDEPPTPEAACSAEALAYKEELLRKAGEHGEDYREAKRALERDYTVGEGHMVRAQKAGMAVMSELAVLAEEEPDCFSLRERTQLKTLERRLRQ